MPPAAARCNRPRCNHHGEDHATPAALAVTLLASAPAQAGYHVTTIDGPAGPALLGTVVDGINNLGLATGYYVVAGDPAHGEPPQRYVGFTVDADGSGFASFARAGYEQTGASGINDERPGVTRRLVPPPSPDLRHPVLDTGLG